MLAGTDSLLIKGNDYYKAGNYEKATRSYETIIDSGYESAFLYFNLGNAYYKSGKLAKAILNYERAKKLAPYNEDIAYNLDMAKSFVIDKLEEISPVFFRSWYTNIVLFISSDAWAYLSLICFIGGLLLMLLYFFTRKLSLKKSGFWFGVLLLLIAVGSFQFSKQNKKIMTSHDWAIIMSPSVTGKTTPDAGGKDFFVLHEGTKVNVEDKIGEWVEIKLSDGNKGWVQAEAVEVI